MDEDDKRIAAQAAVREVRDGMLIGLGTGTTAAYAIGSIGGLVAAGLRIEAVATSEATRRAAEAAGIAVRDFAEVARVDLTIDGADEIDDRLWAIKGGGGAMVREKVVATASNRMVVIADGSKLVARIGGAKLPIEVLPFATAFVGAQVEALGAIVEWRGGAHGRYLSDQGNPILDARFGALPDARGLAASLDALPGVVGHGLFLDEIDAAYIARDGVASKLERARSDR